MAEQVPDEAAASTDEDTEETDIPPQGVAKEGTD